MRTGFVCVDSEEVGSIVFRDHFNFWLNCFIITDKDNVSRSTCLVRVIVRSSIGVFHLEDSVKIRNIRVTLTNDPTPLCRILFRNQFFLTDTNIVSLTGRSGYISTDIQVICVAIFHDFIVMQLRATKSIQVEKKSQSFVNNLTVISLIRLKRTGSSCLPVNKIRSFTVDFSDVDQNRRRINDPRITWKGNSRQNPSFSCILPVVQSKFVSQKIRCLNMISKGLADVCWSIERTGTRIFWKRRTDWLQFLYFRDLATDIQVHFIKRKFFLVLQKSSVQDWRINSPEGFVALFSKRT